MNLKHVIRIFLLLSLLTATAACQRSTSERVNDFIKDYNQSATHLSDPTIIRTFAKRISTDEHLHIKIAFISNIEEGDVKLEVYSAMLPALFTSLVKNDEAAYELIKQNVQFDIVLCSEDQAVLKKVTINRKNVDLLTSKKPTGTNDRSSQFQEMLMGLNQNLPVVVNKKMGISMLKVNVSEANEIVYHFGVSDSTANLFINGNATELLKEDILRTQNIKGFLLKIKTLGLTNIKYIYFDTKGKKLDEITISDKDL